jgi:glycosyltransferase involved in cell wall biosynthesis
MRIGLLFPSIYASSSLFADKIFAPRELLTDLSNGLVARGHTVTVFTAPDFETKARIVASSIDGIKDPLPYFKFRAADGEHRPVLDSEFAKRQFELDCVLQAFKAVKRGDLDVLHCYHDSSLFYAHYLNELMGDRPVVYTLHDPLPPEGSFEYREFLRFSKHAYVSISNSFRHSNLPINFVDKVYHGIDMTIYPFNGSPSDSYLFLGRLVEEKGLHSAIAAVKEEGSHLTVSVNIPAEGEKDAYYESLKVDLARDQFTVLPVVDKAHRLELYGNAKALLFPIQWEEPFGVVLIEAMACGTPVIAYNRGSVPEIIQDGVTGFIIDPDDEERPGKGSWIIKTQGIAGLVEAMKRTGEIDRHACRAHVQKSFTVDTMTDGYVRVYEKLMRGV